MQRTGGGVAPPEGILPQKAESTLEVFPANTPPAANTCRWAASLHKQVKGEKVMKKTIQSMFLVSILLTALLNGCAPASIPVPPTLTPIPPTVISVPTKTNNSTNTPDTKKVEIELFPDSDYTSVDYDSTLWDVGVFNQSDVEYLSHKIINGCLLSPWYVDFGEPPLANFLNEEKRVTIGGKEFRFGEFFINDQTYYSYWLVINEGAITIIAVTVSKEESGKCVSDAEDIIATLH